MFYIYENWVAEGHKARIHLGDCSFCNHGKGFHGVTNERHGRWHGPFRTYPEALQAAHKLGAGTRDCKFCAPQSS